MLEIALPIALVVLAYLVGGIPIGVLVSQSRGVDIRKYGSGNIGASNVLRTLGGKAGLAVWMADVAKGLLPVLWLRPLLTSVVTIGPMELWISLVALAVVVGHCFSPYLKLAGGRGVSTSLGALLAIDWRVGGLVLAVWIVVIAVSRYISLASILAAVSAPLLFTLYADSPYYLALGIILAILIIERHRPNIERLMTGTERKIRQKAEEIAEEPSDESDQ